MINVYIAHTKASEKSHSDVARFVLIKSRVSFRSFPGPGGPPPLHRI